VAAGPPVNRPRSASVSRVIGLTLTKACSQPGIVAVGTSRLLPNTSGKNAMNPKAWTPCGVFTSMPMRADAQHMARAKASSSRQPAMAEAGLVVTRNPRIIPKPMVTATEMTYRTMSPVTAPASGAQRAIGRLRNRSKTPLEMSWLSMSPVPSVANTTVITSSPGSSYCR